MAVTDIFSSKNYVKSQFDGKPVLIKYSEDGEIDAAVSRDFAYITVDNFLKIVKGLEKIANFAKTVYRFADYLKTVDFQNLRKMNKDEEYFRNFLQSVFEFLSYIESTK